MNPSTPTSSPAKLSAFGMVGVALALFVGYYAAAKLGLRLASIDHTVSLLWPASGIAVGILYRFGVRFAPIVFLGSFVVNIEAQQWPIALGIAVGNTFAMALCVVLLRGWQFSPRFDRWPDSQTLLGSAALAMTLSALNGTVWLYGVGHIEGSRFLESFLFWLLGDVAGVMIVAPAILAWPASAPEYLKDSARGMRLMISTIALLIICGLLYVGIISLGVWALAFVFLPFIAIVRVAAAEGAWPAAVHLAVVFGFVMYNQIYAAGPAQFLPIETRVYAAWGYLTALAIASLMTAGIIGERESALMQLQTGEANFKALIEDNPALICRFHVDGRLVFANETFRRAFAIEYGMSSGANFYQLSGLASDGKFLASLHESRACDSAVTTEGCRAVTEAGVRTFRWTARVVKESSGHGIEFHAVGLDVTEQLQAEEERRRIEAQALQTQRLESVGLLAGGIAHEFNNLLTAVLGNAELAEHMLPSDSEVAPLLRDVHKGARRAAELTQQLLNFSARSTLESGPLDLSETVRGLRDLLSIAVPKRCALTFDLAEGVPLVTADESRVRQLLMSLVSNAGEAVSDTNGPVTIRTRTVYYDPAYDPRWRVQGNNAPGWRVLLQVEDRGVGMSASVKARVFEPFFTTKFPGRGLGLAAVLGIAKDHDGAIGVCSRHGFGTSVSVLFRPLDPAVAAIGNPQDHPAHKPSCPYCALLMVEADDTPVDAFVAMPPFSHGGGVIRTGWSSHVRSRSQRIKVGDL